MPLTPLPSHYPSLLDDDVVGGYDDDINKTTKGLINMTRAPITTDFEAQCALAELLEAAVDSLPAAEFEGYSIADAQKILDSMPDSTLRACLRDAFRDNIFCDDDAHLI